MEIKNCCNELVHTSIVEGSDELLRLIIQCFFCGKKKYAEIQQATFDNFENAKNRLILGWNNDPK